MTNPQSPTIYSSSASTVSHDIPGAPDVLPQAHYPLPASITPTSQSAAAASNVYATMPQHAYVSPSMWQDTVASTYVPRDLKRRWDSVSGPAWGGDQHQVKRLY